jgi:hypothetical protein
VARAHDQGEVFKQEHTGEGTALHARVPPGLYAELERFTVIPASA